MGGLRLIDNCKKNLFETINKEGFYINKDTRYTSIDLEQLSSNNVKLLDISENITEKEYVKIKFLIVEVVHELNKITNHLLIN